MKKILLILIVSAIVRPVLCHSAEVADLKVIQQSRDLVFEYSLKGDSSDAHDEVIVEYSLDGGLTWNTPKDLFGDFGKKVYIGKEKRIVWAVLDEFPDGISADADFRVETAGEKRVRQKSRVKGPEAVALSFTDPVSGMEFVPVPGGCFQMGDQFGDGDGDEKPVHEVCVDGFLMGKYEVTQGRWQAVMGNNPSHFENGDNYPVEEVSWNDAQEFIGKLHTLSGKNYRLPTEAEWEYACRSGGKKEKYCGGNDVDAVAWHDANSGHKTHPVGGKQANGLGLYDMSGNVWEWVQDQYDENYYGSSPRNNPQGPSSGAGRVFRGGGWAYRPRGARAAYRGRFGPAYRYGVLGFRLVLPPGQRP